MRSIRQIPIHLVKPSPFNIRRRIDTASLTRSMGSVGQIEPIRVRSEEVFEIVTGEHRFNALKAACATYADAIIVEETDEEVIDEQWDENEERANYPDYERVLKLRQMIDTLVLTQTELAEKIGQDQPWVSRHLSILRLDGIMSCGIIAKITEGQIRPILAAPEEYRVVLVSYIELFFEEREAILSASAIGDYAARAKE